jgi:two-component system response regulator DesR
VLPAVRAHAVDVALLDVQMPGGDGIAVTRELVAAVPTCRVLVVTTFGRPGYLRRAMAAGASGFVVKDTPARLLADAVRRVHAGLRVVDPVLAAESLAVGDSPLTEREGEVLQAAAGGATVAAIAASPRLTEGTVRNHLSAVIGKTGARTRAEAVRVASDTGWLLQVAPPAGLPPALRLRAPGRSSSRAPRVRSGERPEVIGTSLRAHTWDPCDRSEAGTSRSASGPSPSSPPLVGRPVASLARRPRAPGGDRCRVETCCCRTTPREDLLPSQDPHRDRSPPLTGPARQQPSTGRPWRRPPASPRRRGARPSSPAPGVRPGRRPERLRMSLRAHTWGVCGEREQGHVVGSARPRVFAETSDTRLRGDVTGIS